MKPIPYGEVQRKIVSIKNSDNPDAKTEQAIIVAKIVNQATNLIQIDNISKFKSTGANKTELTIQNYEEKTNIVDPDEKIRLWKSAYSLNAEFSNFENLTESDYKNIFQSKTRRPADDIDLDYCTSENRADADDDELFKMEAKCKGWNAYCANPSRMATGMQTRSSSFRQVFSCFVLIAILMMP